MKIVIKKHECKACSGKGWIHDGDDLRAHRRDAGKTLKDVADHLGLSITYVSDLERGSRKITNDLGTRFLDSLKGKTMTNTDLIDHEPDMDQEDPMEREEASLISSCKFLVGDERLSPARRMALELVLRLYGCGVAATEDDSQEGSF